MEKAKGAILTWCSVKGPPDAKELYATLAGDDGLFIVDEGPWWDFKDQWPYSLSDDYFGGIARLICAFSNARGGVVVFGVHDEHRTGGHNRVKINFDRFRQAIKQLIGEDSLLSIRSYADETKGNVDVLFVAPRALGTRPYKFTKKVGKYAPNITWVRSGHEVVEASPIHFPMLYCRANDDTTDKLSAELDGSLPPSPAKLKRFIGRIKVIEDLFDWLQKSDEPRTYLHGKGGSGKSTIAFEFAHLLKVFGSKIKVFAGDKIEGVIFLSAKEKSLVTSSSSVPTITLVEPDFQTQSELYAKILFYGRWIINEETLIKKDLNDLKNELREFFDYTSLVIFIDDIDTLTTKGIDPGSDYIYRTLCRARRSSKIVYTLRNAPTQSIENSIEVPGLWGNDYIEFVRECAQQFKVLEPSPEFRDGILKDLSERRPLVIESIIALVRTAGSYKRAGELFQQHAGEEVRDYVFSREWDALSQSSAARLLLAALSDLNQPTNFSQLETVLQIDPSRLQDAIAEVREMFLTVDYTGDEALFSLAPLTRQFVGSKKDALKYYSPLRERVKVFKRNVYISNPNVAEEVLRIERIIPPRYAEHPPERTAEAWRLVNNLNLTPSVTEDPLFRSLYGYVASTCSPPHVSEARAAFGYAAQMKFEPEFRYLLAWFTAEKNSGIHDGWCERVADTVISGTRYSEDEKIGMISRKATSIYVRGRERLPTNYVDALNCLREALTLHLKAFRLNCVNGSSWANQSEEYARNTAFTLFNALKDSPWEVIDQVRQLAGTKDIYLDPIEDPLRNFLSYITTLKRSDSVNRVRQRVKGLAELLTRHDSWLARSCCERVVELISSADKKLAAILQH